MQHSAQPFDDLVAKRLVAKAQESLAPRKELPIGEGSLTSIQLPGPPATTTDFVKIEKNLASLGFFTPSSKRLGDTKAKTISFTKVIDGKKVEAKATIAPAALYGLPITADQDKYLAFQKFVTDIHQREGRVENPIGFTSAALLRLLGRYRDSGKNYKEIEEWLKVMTSTTIVSEGVVYLAGKKVWAKDIFHVFDRAVLFGRELEPGGEVADKNYVWLSEWQLENINNNHLLPIELETYRKLRNHIAKALVPLLQIWLYASREAGSFEKRYGDLCQFLNIRQYRKLSDIQRKFGPSLDELKAYGYLADWRVERTSDRKDHKIIFFHGEKFHRDRRLRLVKNNPESRLEPASRSEQGPADGEHDDPRLAGLVARGVTEDKARRVLAAVSADQPVLEQLEWGDAQIEQTPGKIRNPAGFYVSLIRDNVSVPETFETTRKREERAAAAEAWRAEKAARERLQDAYRRYQEQEVEKHLAGLSPTELEQLLASARAELLDEHKNLRHLMGDEQLQRLARAKLASAVAKEFPFQSFAAFCEQQKSGEVPTLNG